MTAPISAAILLGIGKIKLSNTITAITAAMVMISLTEKPIHILPLISRISLFTLTSIMLSPYLMISRTVFSALLMNVFKIKNI